MAVTFVVLMLLPTMYATSASVMIDPRRYNVTDLSSILSQLPTDPSSPAEPDTDSHVTRSCTEGDQQLRLYDDPEFNTSLKPTALGAFLNAVDPPGWMRDAGAPDLVSQRDEIIGAFEHNLSVAARGLSTTLTVTFTARDPAKAALIASMVVDTYIENQIDSKTAVGDKTTAWLLNRTQQLAQQVQDDRSAVQLYKARNNLNETDRRHLLRRSADHRDQQPARAFESRSCREAGDQRPRAVAGKSR